MRKRYGVAVAAAACLAVVGGLAVADPYGEDSPKTGEAVSGLVTVTLPTGDTVEVRGDSLLPHPAAGREDVGFRSTRLPGDDRVVMPLDRLGKRADARLFNVDALLRNGYTDAREVGSPDDLGEAVTPSADRGAKARATAAKVTFKYKWLDGETPSEAGAFLINLDTNETFSADVADGTAQADLEPGKYSLVAEMMLRGTGDEPWQLAGTVIDFKVTAEAQTITVDGTRAKRVGVDLDAQATPVSQHLELFTGIGSTADEQIAHSVTFGGADKLYAIPAELSGDHPGGLSLQTELATDDGASTYSVFNVADAGIPTDPSFPVRATDLAVRDTKYNGMGGEAATVARSNWGHHSSHTPFMYPMASPAQLGTSRTEHYTADPDIGWSQHAYLPADGDPYDNVVIDSGSMETGSRDMSWFSAPVSVRLSGTHSPYFNSGFERWPTNGKGELVARLPMFSGAQAGQNAFTENLEGKYSVSLDGKELATGSTGAEISADLPDDADGRFTVSAEATRQVGWTPLGTGSTATWEFDSAPVERNTVLDVSAIRFDAEGVTEGFAEVGRPQEVSLDFETQPGAEDRDCDKLGFEVSYDDGKTWEEVKVDRDGDHATATLEHPADAKFVSVRFDATDDRGQTVKTSTIRSYGLR